VYRVVIVDDEPWSLKGLSKIANWEELGFQVVASYSSGVEALKGIRELRPDVLFTDYRMPEMNGIDLIKQVNELGFHVEYVIVSAYGDFEIAKKAIYYDTCNYILKPLRRDEVIDTLHKLSDRLAKRNNAAEPFIIDPDNLDSGFPRELSFLAKRTVGRPFMSLAISSHHFDRDFFDDIPASVTVTPIEIKSFGPGAIITSTQASNREIYNLIKAKLKPVGVSRLHTSLDNLKGMALEARASLRGDFGYEDNKIVSEVQYYIGSNLDKKLTIRDIASSQFFNESYLCEIFKKHTRYTINTFITKTKMNYAAALLCNHEHTVKQVALAIGFNDTSYFGKQFRRYFGKTPDEYRKLQKGAFLSLIQ
jgi:two-component system response regulator YesN